MMATHIIHRQKKFCGFRGRVRMGEPRYGRENVNDDLMIVFLRGERTPENNQICMRSGARSSTINVRDRREKGARPRRQVRWVSFLSLACCVAYTRVGMAVLWERKDEYTTTMGKDNVG